jgi:hypothetical protein
MVQLSTGNIVVAYTGNGTTNTTNLNIVFRNLQGVATISPITIVDTNISGVRVRKIGTTGFVVSWGASAVLKFAIYNNDGSVVLSTTTVATASATITSNTYNVDVTASGDIVFAYNKVTSGDLVFTRYNSSGTIQGSETVVATAPSALSIKVLVNAAGGFWIYYYRGAATTGWYFARYNSTGTLQGTVTTVLAASGNSWTKGGNIDYSATELTGGNVVFFCTQASGFISYAVFSSTGTSVKAATILDATASTYALLNTCPSICLNGTGFVVASHGTNSAVYFYTFDSTGIKLIDRTATAYTSFGVEDLSVNISTKRAVYLYNLGSSGFAILIYVGTQSVCVPQYTVSLFAFRSTGVTVGTPIDVYATGNTVALGTTYGILTSDGSIAFTTATNTAAVGFGVYAVQKKSVIGVAQEAIAVNSTGRIATYGTYTVNQSFSAGGNFDNRTVTPPGVKGTAVGTSAVLFGMS